MAELLPELLFEAAEARPAHPAVEGDGGALTYRQLAERAAALSGALKACGVEPGDRVGLLLPKCVDAVCGLYGIMWAGGVYVPLDAAAPAHRLGYMVRNCGMKALVSSARQTARMAEQLQDTELKQIILVDADKGPADLADRVPVPLAPWPVAPVGEPLPRPTEASPDDLAYILYTSGSTGDPKGVMISHRNALAFVEWSRDTVDVGPDDRLSSHAPFHFDLSVFDLYVASLARATLVLVPEGTSLFPVKLASWIEEQAITVWYSVPSILVQMLTRGRLDRFEFPKLRVMLFAGEVFVTKYLREWMLKLPKAEWYNLYGPTETNVCTYYHVPEPPDGDAPIPIGKASSGDRIILRDESGNVITETGKEGEIWVDGPTVAKGYWGDQTKTAERFVVDTELTGDERRVYRTGDLASWRPDGHLTFLGRRDHMIKSRGYRIELGEIEAAAAGHPAVQEFCAVAIPDPDIGNSIRACVVTRDGSSLDREELERHLADRVPRYMVPHEVIFLPKLPKTSTGKIDRRALAEDVSQ